MSNVTPEQTRAALAVVQAVSDTVRELKRVPSGHVYAVLMGRVSLTGYQKILGILKRGGVIEETPGHELVWIGDATRAA